MNLYRGINMQKKYNPCYDLLTILACLMVVFFHMNGEVYNYSNTISWKISVIERCVVYSAIPIFFMLSGAKLMDYRSRYTTKEYVQKRLLRVGVPFLFWNIFYICYLKIAAPENSFHSLRAFVTAFLNSGFEVRYWFFYPLFAVYAAIPVISLVLQADNHRKYLWYAVYVAFAIQWVLQPLCSIFGVVFNDYMTMPVCGGYLMYAVFGYLVSTEIWSRKKRVILYCLALLSGVFAVWSIIRASAHAGKTWLYMASYDYFPSALTAAAIFVFVRHLFQKADEKSGKAAKFLRTLSGCCMGIWLTHSIAITVLARLTGLSAGSYVWRFVCPFAVFGACAVGTYVLKKIPILKHIV